MPDTTSIAAFEKCMAAFCSPEQGVDPRFDPLSRALQCEHDPELSFVDLRTSDGTALQ